VGQREAWRRAAATLKDLPHLGHYTTNADGTITRHRSEESQQASKQRKQRLSTTNTAKPMTKTATTKKQRKRTQKRRPRQQHISSGTDRHGNSLEVNDKVHVECGKLKGREYIIDSFSSENYCRLQVGGGNASTKAVKTKQVRLVPRAFPTQ
jgi:hypothetical protein